MPPADQDTAVVRERIFDAPPEEVWEALTDEVLLEQWLADEVELDIREGGRGRFEWEDGDAREAEIVRVEPAERLTWWWWAEGEEAARVDFRLDPTESGTRLIVVETRASGWSGARRWDIKLSALARMHAQSVCL